MLLASRNKAINTASLYLQKCWARWPTEYKEPDSTLWKQALIIFIILAENYKGKLYLAIVSSCNNIFPMTLSIKIKIGWISLLL